MHPLIKIFIISLTAFLGLNASAQEVSFEQIEINFQIDSVHLSGTIYSPKNPIAALVIVHGSGQEKRYKDFGQKLAKKGFCVLTYDKRGVGASGGTYAGPEVGTNNVDSANLNLLAVDAASAVSALSKFVNNSDLKIGLIGVSQAGWIIPIAARKNSAVDFMVIYNGAVLTAKEQLRFQFYTESKPDFWENHTEEDARYHTGSDSDKYEFIDTDPNKTLANLNIPGIWIFGGKDVQVPVALSIENLEKLKVKGKPYEYRLYPDLDHNTSFTKSNEPFEIVSDWIKKEGKF